jgi:hypothetical protein
MERNRFKGSADDLFRAIVPFATSKSFVRFDETEDIMKLKVNKDMKQVVQDHAGLLEAMHALQPNLCFPGKVLQAALDAVLVAKAGQWDMDDRHHKDWLKTISVRLRNLLRVVGQGVLKKRSWAADLPWAAAEGDASPEEKEVQYFFSFDSELSMAIRVAEGSKNKEPCQFFKEPVEAEPDDAMLAVWPDGMTRQQLKLLGYVLQLEGRMIIKLCSAVYTCCIHCMPTVIIELALAL